MIGHMTHVQLSEAVKRIDWDCVAADTQYCTHSIHRYSGKFIPQIARQTLELTTVPGEIVLDPYCGSGTTLLESALSSRKSVGIDLNPLAVLISQVKTTTMPTGFGPQLLDYFAEEVGSLIGGPSLFSSVARHSEMESAIRADARWQDEWYCKWFTNDNRRELIAINHAICAISDDATRRVALLAFSDILRRCSNANPGYPNVMFDKNRGAPPSAAILFMQRLAAVCVAVETLRTQLPEYSPPLIVRGDARRMAVADSSIDAIITHPPYIGSIPYAEYGALSLQWLGFNSKELDSYLTGGRRQSNDVVLRFELGFRDMIEESWRVLKPGRFMVMLLGSPIVKGIRADLPAMAVRLAQSAGFTLAVRQERAGINRRANLMGEESILFFAR